MADTSGADAAEVDRALASTAARGTRLGHISQAFSPLGGNDLLAESTGCFVPLQLLLGSHFHPKAMCLIFLILRLTEKKTLCARAGSTVSYCVTSHTGLTEESLSFCVEGRMCSHDTGESPQIKITNEPASETTYKHSRRGRKWTAGFGYGQSSFVGLGLQELPVLLFFISSSKSHVFPAPLGPDIHCWRPWGHQGM